MSWVPIKEEKATLKFDFKSGGAGQIDCKVGDALMVKEKYLEQWYKGKNVRTGQYGMVPVSYVQRQSEKSADDLELEALLSGLDTAPATTTTDLDALLKSINDIPVPKKNDADAELDALLSGLALPKGNTETEARKTCAEKYGCKAKTLDPKCSTWASHLDCINAILKKYQLEKTPQKLFTYSKEQYSRNWPILALTYNNFDIKHVIALVDHGVPLNLDKLGDSISLLNLVMGSVDKPGVDWLVSIWEKDPSKVPWALIDSHGATAVSDMVRQCSPTKEDTMLQILDVMANKVKFNFNVVETRNNGTYDWKTLTTIQHARSAKVLKWLLDHGANPNLAGGEYGSISALSDAAMRGDIESAKLLIKHGAKVVDDVSSQRPPMFAAACNGKIDFIEWMVKDLMVDINLVFNKGTVLHEAAVNHSDICPRLVQLGANENAVDRIGRTWRNIVDEVMKRSMPKGFIPATVSADAPAAPAGGPPPPGAGGRGRGRGK